MSFSFQYSGKLPAVRAKVQAENKTFTVPGEQEIHDAAKTMALAALDAIDDSKAVTVSVNGSAYSPTAKCAKGAAVDLAVYEIPGFLE